MITAELDHGHTPTLLEAAPRAGTADEQDEDDEDHREKGYQLEVDEDEEREANSDSYDVAEGSDKDDVEPKEQPTRPKCHRDILLFGTMQLSVIYGTSSALDISNAFSSQPSRNSQIQMLDMASAAANRRRHTKHFQCQV